MYKKIVLAVSLLFATQLMAKKQALLVTVGNYRGSESDLPGIERDLYKMKKLFNSWGFETKVLQNQESMQLEEYLKIYATTLSKKDTFVLYYSGHGSHTPDIDGDEEDGQDESIVLSDGVKNYHFIDDDLNYRLNQIQAKKMILFDSCHSGTAHKGASETMIPKSIPTNRVVAGFFDKGTQIRGGEIESGEYIVLSASKDYEESLATTDGSLFTSEMYNILSNPNNKNKSLNSIIEEVTYNIVNRCKQGKAKAYHSNLSVSNEALKNSSIKAYLSIAKRAPMVTPSPAKVDTNLETQLDLMISSGQKQIGISNAKKSYNTKDYVNFSLNTNGEEGYLTLLYVDKSDVTVLYPNPRSVSKPMSGRYTFPKDFGNFKIEAYKNCKNCQQEKTAIYILLTPKPLGDLENMSRQKLLSFEKSSVTSKIVSKAVGVVYEEEKSRTNEGFAIGKYEFVVY